MGQIKFESKNEVPEFNLRNNWKKLNGFRITDP
jgi:hypothetical protein